MISALDTAFPLLISAGSNSSFLGAMVTIELLARGEKEGLQDREAFNRLDQSKLCVKAWLKCIYHFTLLVWGQSFVEELWARHGLATQAHKKETQKQNKKEGCSDGERFQR